MIVVSATVDILIIWFVLTWMVQVMARIFMPNVKFEEEKFVFAWPRSPRWYFKRLSKKEDPEKIAKAAAFWMNLFFASTRLLNPARVPMIVVFMTDIAFAVLKGPGAWNTIDILVDMWWIWLILDDLRRDDNWRKRAKKLKEKVVATQAGLKVVPVKG